MFIPLKYHKIKFFFFFYEFSRTNGRLNGRLFPSSNIIKLYYITSCVLYIRILIREYLFTVYIYKEKRFETIGNDLSITII